MGVRRAALLTAGLTLAGSALGLVRDVVIAAVFGAGPAVDAFLVAQGLMNLVLGLVAGALAKAAIPVVARAAAAGRAADGVASVRAALGLSGVVLLLGGVAMWIGAPAVVAVLAPGFDAGTAAVAVDLTRVVLVATVLISATNLLAGAGQALGRFAPAAVQGLGFNVVMIAAAGLAGPVFGVTALAWGFVLGSAVRLVIQIPAVRGVVARPWPTLRLRDPGLREMLRLLPALLVGSAAANVNSLVDRAVASTVSDGAIAAVNFAARLVATVDMLVVATLLAALYPRLSAAVSAERRAELRGLVERGMGALTAVLVPVAVVLSVVSTEVVSLVFGRGEFDAAAVATTGSVAAVLAVGLPVLAVREVAARTAYALGDGRIAVRSALAAMAVNVAGDLALAPAFGVTGIAAATVASGVVGTVVAVHGLAGRHQAVPSVPGTLGGVLAAGLAAAALAAGTRALLAGAGDTLVVAVVGLITLTGYLVALRFTAPRQFRLLADVPREVLRGR
ncbi:murein biosynthesis integral membrane protein MurJ [Actinokineospora fastidiosa]|uniref:Lipid II flippase MurJ n=1 Tax=Actinokineospora fastidiosa TaxID=1816 RepID=A0A918GKF0_9PSEU|nr:murein biosynthesis integral membrane protein MurJ [Actinokineospora fastidiosa]GGS43766.1 hypothetical protein GCM10010171_43660 [Actinokineospora fastidiosa]